MFYQNKSARPVFARVFALFLFFGPLCGCGRVERETVEIAVPEMTSPAAAQMVLQQLSGVLGIQDVTPDLTRGTVTVSFESTQIALKNIEHLIADSGFNAGTIPGNPSARKSLPPDLQ